MWPTVVVMAKATANMPQVAPRMPPMYSHQQDNDVGPFGPTSQPVGAIISALLAIISALRALASASRVQGFL